MPALTRLDEERLQHEGNASDRAAAALLAARAAAGEDADGDEEEWEDAAVEDSSCDGGSAAPAEPPPPPNSRAARLLKEATAAARAEARLVWRTGLLCGLARVVALDAAADGDAARAAALSLLSSPLLDGLAVRDGSVCIVGLRAVASWWAAHVPPRPWPPRAAPASACAGCAPAAAAALADAAARAAPTGDEAPALLAAALRGAGARVRTLWAPADPPAAATQAGGGGRKAGTAAAPSRKPPPPSKKAKELLGLTGGALGPSVSAPPPPPPPLRKSDAELETQLRMAEEATAAAAAAAAAARGERPPGDAPRAGSAWARSAARRPPLSPFFEGGWIEVLVRGGEDGPGKPPSPPALPRWVATDPATGAVDASELAPTARQNGSRPLPPRVAAVWGGGARCGAARYARGAPRPPPSRGPAADDAAWWAATLAALPPCTDDAGGAFSSSAAAAAAAVAERAAEAAAATAAAAPPTTVDGFRNHPAFVLARFIGRYKGVATGAAPAGAHRGEPFWRAADVVDLHSASRWARMGFVVCEEWVDTPAKSVPPRGAPKQPSAGKKRRGAAPSPPPDDNDDGNWSEGEWSAPPPPLGAPPPPDVALFGPWQVALALAPAAAPGVVPGRNQYGTIDVHPLTTFLPPGTAHVAGRGAALAARALGVDAAPAVTGFGGPSRARRPVVDGVVVLAEHAAAVAAAAAEADARREDVAEAKARAVAEAGWRRLLSAALARVRLGNEHGAGGAAPSDAAEVELI